jgi:CRP/FNR family cyclic AMP-dependent transcriptional regulator
VPDVEVLRSFLSRTPFFGGLSDDALRRVAAMLKERQLEDGAVLFRQGDPGRSMFVIARGEVLMTVARPLGGEIRLVRLGVGDFFGEVTLIEMQPRLCTARCTGPTLLFELTGMDLYRLYREDVQAYVMVLQNINRELCRRLRSADETITEYADELGAETTQVRNPGSSGGVGPLDP